MSKLKVNRRQIILDKALEMFNERGIEYVGLRELAGMLGMRVSNITYYFPTKDDLVYGLSLQLGKANGEIITQKENLSLTGFLQMLQQVFQNHIKFRCLLLSVVHLTRQNIYLAAEYKKTQLQRNLALSSNIRVLVTGGYLNANESDKDFLVAGTSLVSRFWISEAEISYQDLNSAEKAGHYLRLVMKLFSPYATEKGKKEMAEFLQALPQ